METLIRITQLGGGTTQSAPASTLRPMFTSSGIADCTSELRVVGGNSHQEHPTGSHYSKCTSIYTSIDDHTQVHHVLHGIMDRTSVLRAMRGSSPQELHQGKSATAGTNNKGQLFMYIIMCIVQQYSHYNFCSS